MEFKHLDAFLKRITETTIPGADCAVYYHHEPVFRKCYGYADVEAKRPLTPDAMYYLYSASKVITCAAALQLHERGEFVMFQPVSDFIPEFREMKIARRLLNGSMELVPATHPIRIQDLFTMTGGLSYDLDSPAIRRVRRETDGRCPTLETVRAIAGEPLLFEPGTRWNYSLCHDVIGALIEVISGKSFGEYLRENIFEPLGMKDTSFHLPEEKHARMAAQYAYDGAARTYAPKAGNDYVFGSEYESGGAGLISTVDDYMRFAETLCRFGISAEGERILSENSVRLMRMNHLTSQTQPDFNWTHLDGYGYGLGVRTLVDPTRISTLSLGGEFGWSGAAGAYVIMDPETELTVYYAQHMLNSQEEYVHPRLRNIIYAALQ